MKNDVTVEQIFRIQGLGSLGVWSLEYGVRESGKIPIRSLETQMYVEEVGVALFMGFLATSGFGKCPWQMLPSVSILFTRNFAPSPAFIRPTPGSFWLRKWSMADAPFY